MTRFQDLNLSRRPFLNRRPVRRLTAALWVLAAVLTVLTGWLYFQHFTGSRLTGEQQVEVRERIEKEARQIADLRARMQTLEVATDNAEARYLNRRIEERAFSWSALFDHLTEAMPGRVRLTSLSPQFAERDSRRRRNDSLGTEDVQLAIRGTAKSDQDLLAFVDLLFAHDRFRAPDLLSENRVEGGEYEFVLNVVYRSALTVAEAPPSEQEAEAATAEGEPE